MTDFAGAIELGRSRLVTSRMGIGADTGVTADALEWGFERGLNYFYWGTRRTQGMQTAIRNLAPRQRERMIVALQTYDITGLAMNHSFRWGLRQLGLDYADILILGKRDHPIPRRIQDKALRLKDAGLVRHLCVSAHDRSTFRAHLATGIFDLIMVRYNCAHTGAEQEVFPLVAALDPRPGVIVYNSTRWGHLCDPNWMPAGETTPQPTHLYRHALSHPTVDMVLSAPQTRQQLEENFAALGQGPLNHEEVEWLGRIGRHVHSRNPSTEWDFLIKQRGARK